MSFFSFCPSSHPPSISHENNLGEYHTLFHNCYLLQPSHSATNNNNWNSFCVCGCVYTRAHVHECMLMSQRRGSSVVWADAVYNYSLCLVPCFRTVSVNQCHIILFSFHQFIMSATTTDMAIFHHVDLVTMLQVLQNRINTVAQNSGITHSNLLNVVVSTISALHQLKKVTKLMHSTTLSRSFWIYYTKYYKLT